MRTLSERIAFLVSHRGILEKWVGAYDAESLRKWLDSELGDSRRLEEWVDGSRVLPRGPVLHVVSGNTGHAAFQSVFRAILLGCESWVKVPSVGLPEFEGWAASVASLKVRRDLPDNWKSPETAVIYGGAETLSFFREWLSPETRIIEHGPKLSAAFVFENRDGLASDLAEDIMRYNQRGCLSVQAVYFQGDIESFARELSAALGKHPAETPTLPEAGAVRNERETLRFRIANGSPNSLLESANSTAWTIVIDREDATLRPGPGSGFVRLIRMPQEISRETIGLETAFLSTAVVEPITEADRLESISPPRICPAGKAQEPGIFWHPDGEMPLAGLVRWRDLG